jgi:hypothetical protein
LSDAIDGPTESNRAQHSRLRPIYNPPRTNGFDNFARIGVRLGRAHAAIVDLEEAIEARRTDALSAKDGQ